MINEVRIISDLIENRSIETIQTGVSFEDGAWICLTCGERFEPGEVYPFGTRFFDAEKAAKLHTEQAHGAVLDRLLDAENKYVTLTDNQKNLMRLLAEGYSDAEVAKMTGTASATVRRQRFAFREKAKQAKMYLALYNLMLAGKRGETPAETLLPVHEGARPAMMDDRFVITEEENERFLKNAFSSLDPPRLRALPVREKRKVAVLRLVARQFQPGVNYTERQVNDLLREIFPGDFVSLRRYLIEYGYLDRENDGSRYWVNT